MDWKSIYTIISGIGLHGYGVNWTPPVSQTTIAKRVIVELEDRRVLYKRTEYEYPVACENSVQEIRKMLTNEIKGLQSGTRIEHFLRVMRTTCQHFLDTLQDNQLCDVDSKEYTQAKHWEFIYALERLRGDFGYCIAYLSAIYQVNVEKNLSQIMPVARWGRILDPLNISRS